MYAKHDEHYLEVATWVGHEFFSLQLLGPLPQFSQKNSTSFKNNPLQFDDELDNLLNDDHPDHHDTSGSCRVLHITQLYRYIKVLPE